MLSKLKKLFGTPAFSVLYLLLAPVLVSVIAFLQMQYSLGVSLSSIVGMAPEFIIWNIACVYTLLLFLAALTGRLWISELICSLFFAAFSYAAYYVLAFHGTPLTVWEIVNAATAANVAASYDLSPNQYTVRIIEGLVLCLVVTLPGLYIRRFRMKSYGLQRLLSIAASAALLWGCLYVGIFSPEALKPRNSVFCRWADSAKVYGFLALELESHFQTSTELAQPEGYSETAVAALLDGLRGDGETANGSRPDIIFILNESFCDLSLATDVETDVDYLAGFHGIDNCISGYAVAPEVGGGTNRSEYELLTSNCMSLLPGITPFQVLDVQGRSSVVSYLESLGYDTCASHPADAVNYARDTAFPALGFDRSFFLGDFEAVEYYGSRYVTTDASAYDNLIRWYDDGLQEGTPRFLYLLTMQNHAWYAQNPAELDTVHVKEDYAGYGDVLNEYLTGVKMSADAFAELTEHFKNSQRDVIICMVGDHSPPFIGSIEKEGLSDNDRAYLSRSVPFVIWSNRELKSAEPGYISMNYLLPLVLDSAGVRLSPFYRYQMEMMASVPVITANSSFYTADMQSHPFDADIPEAALVRDYTYMSYNSIQGDTLWELFEP